jgi:all-beta uncharacterized protein/BACON domain-containing protein
MSSHSCLDAKRHVRRRHFFTLAIAVLLLGPASAFAQSIVDPTTAEFDPSADHTVTVSGTPVVDHYEIGFYLIAAAQPLQVNQLGKPSPDVDGKIRVALGARPASGILYEARVSAVGPGGTGLSAVSNNFTFSVPCSTAVSPTTQAMAAGGGAASVAVTTASGCAWTATGPTWVTITSGATGSGNGTVSYTVAANTLTTSRTGTLTVAGQTVTVTQSGTCSFAASPTTQAMAAGGGAASVAVTTTSGCAWTATESLGWITITSGGSGTGNGTVSYTASANTLSSSRTGTLTAAGQAVTITQSGACSFAVSPTTQAMAAGGDVATVSVTTASGCAWTATESISWITITSGGSGTGNGTVSYSVSANTSTSPRTGTLTVGGQAITITQPNQAPAPAPGVPSNLHIISRAEQCPLLEDRCGGIGAAPATSKHDAPVANGWVAAIA